jgi:hypothetical protein
MPRSSTWWAPICAAARRSSRATARPRPGFYRNSALRVEVEDAREVVPGLIVAHVHSEVSGDDRAPGELRRTLLTLVIERRADRWRIIAGHNTVVTTTPG